MEKAVAVRARGIAKTFSDVVALDGVDFEVAEGQIHGVVGPNGAGKTTLLGLLLGLAAPDEGRLEILGTLAGKALSTPDGVAGFVDGPGLYPTLTARQNLAALAALRAVGAGSARVDDVLEQVGLSDVANDRVRGFSLGMRQRLGLAAALLTSPRLLVLDEPSNGLDPAGRKHIYRVLNQLADNGATVVLSSHRMDDVETLCTEVTLVASGRVVFTGPLGKLSAESRELEYRLRTSDTVVARELAARSSGIRLVEGADGVSRIDIEVLVVRALVPAIEKLVAELVRADIAVRELAPVVSPLEAAFLALTEPQESSR
jgi:ABC-2 type transport system ATP-binding protein